MKVAYLAGPYRGKSWTERRQNVEQARTAAGRLWNWFAVITPHLNTQNFSEEFEVPEETYLAGYLMILEKCDVLFLLVGWQKSKGTIAEMLHAEELHIPVYEFSQLSETDLWKIANS